jgi:hypothetical protein
LAKGDRVYLWDSKLRVYHPDVWEVVGAAAGKYSVGRPGAGKSRAHRKYERWELTAESELGGSGSDGGVATFRISRVLGHTRAGSTGRVRFRVEWTLGAAGAGRRRARKVSEAMVDQDVLSPRQVAEYFEDAVSRLSLEVRAAGAAVAGGRVRSETEGGESVKAAVRAAGAPKRPRPCPWRKVGLAWPGRE